MASFSIIRLSILRSCWNHRSYIGSFYVDIFPRYRSELIWTTINFRLSNLKFLGINLARIFDIIDKNILWIVYRIILLFDSRLIQKVLICILDNIFPNGTVHLFYILIKKVTIKYLTFYMRPFNNIDRWRSRVQINNNFLSMFKWMQRWTWWITNFPLINYLKNNTILRVNNLMLF